jgi:hypothetical protein
MRRNIPPLPKPVSKKLHGYAKDAYRLVKVVEKGHPIFLMDGLLPQNYEIVRNNFLAAAQKDMTRKDFIFAAKKYITTLKDGHMRSWLLESEGDMNEPIFSDFLNVSWVCIDEKLYLTDEQGNPSTRQVVRIGGVDISKVYSVVEEHHYSENHVDRMKCIAYFTRYVALIELAGCEVTDSKMTLTIDDKGEVSTVNVSTDAPPSYYTQGQHDYLIRHEIKEDVFIIDLRSCEPGKHINAAASQVENALKAGIRKFIIDLRGNAGGISGVGLKLLKAMGIKAPNFGVVERISGSTALLYFLLYPLLRPWPGLFMGPLYGLFVFPFRLLLTIGFKIEPCVKKVENPNNVFVSALTDENTYSSATMLATWVQDGNFGNVIGSPSSNSPSCFGDMTFYYLKTSKILGGLSRKYFKRPEVTADPATLKPDIEIDPGNAMDAALEYLRNMQ